MPHASRRMAASLPPWFEAVPGVASRHLIVRVARDYFVS
jgi:hypothetical protein